MSLQNVETVREAIRAINSGDVERFASLAHPDFEGRVAPELSAEPDTYRGRAGIQSYFASFTDAFDGIVFDAEGFSDAGDSVVVGLRMTATSKLTKIPVEQRNAGVWSVLGGKIIRIETYATLPEALAAAGLGG